MQIKDCFPIWNKLTEAEQRRLTDTADLRTIPAGTLLQGCIGLLAIGSGQMRAFMLSDEGKEVTLYRLFERDMCLFSASCMMNSIQFEITFEAEKETQAWLIPVDVYRELMDSSLEIANYTNQLMATRFSEVMWLVEQIMWKSFDKRLAGFLLAESALEGSDNLKITHDKIAAHLGTAREVVTRMLRYFQNEGMVALTRGSVEITDADRLQDLAE